MSAGEVRGTGTGTQETRGCSGSSWLLVAPRGLAAADQTREETGEPGDVPGATQKEAQEKTVHEVRNRAPGDGAIEAT